MYDAYAMTNHDYSEIARACVREYVEQNTDLIHSWLDGSGTLEDVSAELILSEVERYNLNGKPDLRGIAGPIIDKLFREAPGGEIAARRYLAECIASGHGVPMELERLCRELLLNKPIGKSSKASPTKRGPKNKNGRRDLLIWLLMKVLQANFDISKRSNDAREDDPDFPDSALEIIRDELSKVDPEIGKISLKRLHNAAQEFASNYEWFTN